MNPKNKGKEQQPVPRDALPFLPTQRARALTPPPTSEEGTSAVQNLGLFGRLPYELRRQILVDAFGGRTIHVDLAYGHPMTRRPAAAGAGTAARSPGAPHCGLGSELVPDTRQRERWRWFSCVCHRRAGYSEPELAQRRADVLCLRSETIEPCDDTCLEGAGCDCEPSGTACFVGAMGWLVACRQAYVSKTSSPPRSLFETYARTYITPTDN